MKSGDQAAERACRKLELHRREETKKYLFRRSRLRTSEVTARLRVTKLGAAFKIEYPEQRGAEINSTVQSEHQALRQRNMDPDRVFAKRREAQAEALAAR